ncbi:MAG TPA: hypothetical protein VIK31_11295, partial [Propionibacteriaceae bacterium]
EMRLDSGSWTTATQISTSVLGAHTVYARAFDVAGNERDVSVNFSVSAVPVPDTTAPAPVPDPSPTPTPIPVPAPAVTPTATLRASSTLFDYGRTTTLWIAVAPVSSMSVRIEKKTASSPEWAQVATLTTDASGAALLTIRPLVTTEYRTVLVDGGMVSNTVTIGVKAATTIRSSKKSVHKSSHATVSGMVKAASRGTAVLQRRKANGRWVSIKRIATSRSGRYSVRVGWSKRGTYSYRIRVARSGTNAAAVSRTIKIRVR